MADTTETGLPRAVTIAWGMHEVPQRGPARGLSHERIVAAAVEIADTEGLGAVTMQAVAKSLGFTTMSLYRYVSGKDELLRLMQDAAFALPKKVTLPASWQAALRRWAGLLREVHRAHLWALEIPRGPTSVLLPNSVRAADLGLRALAGLRLDDDEKIATILVVSQYVASAVELERSLAAEGELSLTPEGAEMLTEVITPERFPYLAPVMAAGDFVVDEPSPAQADDDAHQDTPSAADPAEAGPDEDFEFGLDLIIMGLEERERRHRTAKDDAHEHAAGGHGASRRGGTGGRSTGENSGETPGTAPHPASGEDSA